MASTPIQFEPETLRRLAALDIGERAEVRVVMKEQPPKRAKACHYIELSTNVSQIGKFQFVEDEGYAETKMVGEYICSPFGPPDTRLIADGIHLVTVASGVERLQDTSWDDMVADIESRGWDVADESDDGEEEDWMAYWDYGQNGDCDLDGASSCECVDDVFRRYWGAAHPKPEHKWAANPWCWLATLERGEG